MPKKTPPSIISGNTTVRNAQRQRRAAGVKPKDVRPPTVTTADDPGNTITIDPTALYECAKTHASYEQMGLIFGVSGTIIREKYGDLVLKARADQQKNLLSAQFSTAINDRNPTMQIWLGKQYLGQRDVQRQELTGADGKPLKGDKTVIQIRAVMPSNGRENR